MTTTSKYANASTVKIGDKIGIFGFEVYVEFVAKSPRRTVIAGHSKSPGGPDYEPYCASVHPDTQITPLGTYDRALSIECPTCEQTPWRTCREDGFIHMSRAVWI